ncbi:MAG: RagB/SusD family nutrient uptake outer membrane protein, partial [Chitinophagaceae bacterium]
DYAGVVSIPGYLIPGDYSSQTTSGWSWGNLRNINYFLANAPQAAEKAGVPLSVIQNYVGIARFFRAWFYFNMVVRYGDVPWYSQPLNPSDTTELYKPRDPRTLVMDSVLADLDYACNNIDSTKDNTRSTITKWVALAFKSRVCLFEGTFREYHPELNLQSTSAMWLQQAVDAAQELMQSGQYTIHVDAANPQMSYRELFIDESGAPPSDEVILAYDCSNEFNVFTDANWYYTSPTEGVRLSLTKQFVNTYLDIDGTRFTDKPGYDTIPFWNETKGRDLRLQQTIRTPGYARANGALTPPDFSYTMTGYQPIKYTLASTATDGVAQNDNSIPVIRYAEVLLNYAEAKAELGTFTQADWDATIKVLRVRAGITNTSMPTTADPYLQKIYFPNISNPVLLEIRRCRGIELALEGFRFDDLLRWGLGNLLEMPYEGMYVPAMNTLYDLNGDGKPDVDFVSQTPANKVPGVIYVTIDNSQMKLSNGTSGNLLWLTNQTKEWDNYKYYYPIPFSEIQLNPNLKQNPGWQ